MKAKVLFAKVLLKIFDIFEIMKVHSKKIFLASIIALILSITLFIGVAERFTHIPSQMVIAEISFIRSGEKKIPVDLKLTSDQGETNYCTQCLYNSKWVEQQMNLIVPMFFYDGLTQKPTYPAIIGVIPYSADQAETIAGYEYFDPSIGRVVMINDKYQYLKSWNDERDLLATFTHELIHAQGYGFDGYGTSEIYEAKTQAASTEILAAMCNKDQNQLACKAFWLDMFNYSHIYVKVKLDSMNLDFIYKIWSRIFFWNSGDLARYDKSLRYWSSDKDQYQYVLRAYSINPYIQYLIPAVFGAGLDTMAKVQDCQPINQNGMMLCSPDSFNTLKLDFDDTKYQLGWMWILLPPPYNF